MTASFSPLNMPSRRVAPVEPVAEVVYSTTTGDKPRGPVAEYLGLDRVVMDPEPYCFVCSRCTDHFAEHDALVDAGLARYTGDGTVHRTEAWDDALAKEIARAEYEAFERALADGTL